MKPLFFIYLFFILLPLTANSQLSSYIVAPGVEIELLAEGFSFTEGPAVDREGNVYFTDQPNDRILVWSVSGELSVFKENMGRANGLYFDRNGNLLSCSDKHNELWSIAKDGSYKVLVSHYNGKKLNGPNDLWPHPDGGIYFTDPLYKRDYWTRNPEIQQDGEHLYYLHPDGETLIRVDEDLKKPNGIIGTPDGKKLYVADIGDQKTYVYDIQPNGSLTNKKLFCTMGSDGMTIDAYGNIYLTGKGITVFNSKGELIEQIRIDAGWTANVCFGGPDLRTLFITASECLYSLEMNVSGVR